MHPGTKTLAKVYRITDAAIDRWLARLSSGAVVRLDRDEPMPDDARFLWHIYAETRDVGVVQFVEGATPETFYVRPLSKSESREAMLRGSDVERREFAFARGLVRVDQLELDTGERRDWTRPSDGSDKPKPIPERIVEEHFDPATVWEIGEVICQLSFYRRQSERTFALPHTSLDALQVIARRPAAQTSASSSSGKTKPDPAATSATPPSSPDGAGSTDATATGSPTTTSTGPGLSTDGQHAVSI